VVANGQKVAVNYIGWLVNGQSFDSGQYSFTLGGTGVIAGWNVGIVGMKIGEIRRLLIPASLGYGATGSGPIPPNATLVFDVQVASAT
jgi:FKBP-type peptidyl-prolyl cis-trans isomerase